MKPTRSLRNGTGDFFEKWVSRGKTGTAFDGTVTKDPFTPQMEMRGSPYPKIRTQYGVPKPHERYYARQAPRDWAPSYMKPLEWSDLTPQEEADRETRLPGVLWASELPQDPVDRLFFQVKQQNAELLAPGNKADNPDNEFEQSTDTGREFAGKRHYMREPLARMCSALNAQKVCFNVTCTLYHSPPPPPPLHRRDESDSSPWCPQTRPKRSRVTFSTSGLLRDSETTTTTTNSR